MSRTTNIFMVIGPIIPLLGLCPGEVTMIKIYGQRCLVQHHYNDRKNGKSLHVQQCGTVGVKCVLSIRAHVMQPQRMLRKSHNSGANFIVMFFKAGIKLYIQ